jgi:hypothetical protein
MSPFDSAQGDTDKLCFSRFARRLPFDSAQDEVRCAQGKVGVLVVRFYRSGCGSTAQGEVVPLAYV